MSYNLIKETFVCYRKDLTVVEEEWKMMHDKENKDVAHFDRRSNDEEEEKLLEKLKMMPVIM